MLKSVGMRYEAVHASVAIWWPGSENRSAGQRKWKTARNRSAKHISFFLLFSLSFFICYLKAENEEGRPPYLFYLLFFLEGRSAPTRSRCSRRPPIHPLPSAGSMSRLKSSYRTECVQVNAAPWVSPLPYMSRGFGAHSLPLIPSNPLTTVYCSAALQALQCVNPRLDVPRCTQDHLSCL